MGEHQDSTRAVAAREEGERAERATLWPDAARAYEEALSLVAGTDGAAPEEAALLTALGRCYWRDGQARPAWRTLRRAIALYRDIGDCVGQGQATAELLAIWGPPERQRAMADEALDALGDREPGLRATILLRTRRHEEALAIGELHGLEDVLAVRLDAAANRALEAGRINEFAATLRELHRTYARFALVDVAFGPLRYGSFALMQAGLLRDGIAMAEDARAYARSTHLRFHEQLALMDLVGAWFARGDSDRCLALLAESPGDADFRADLYRAWIAQRRGDIEGAVRLLVDPARAGGAPTAISQIHGAAAGVLFAAGEEAAARRELESWAEAARPWDAFVEEAAGVTDALVALGDDALVREVRDAFARHDDGRKVRDRYAALQGRGFDEVRGALALREGDLAGAVAEFAAGLSWAEGEGCAVDAGRCLLGLGGVALRAGDVDAAVERFTHAARAFEDAGAVYELGRANRRRSTASAGAA